MFGIKLSQRQRVINILRKQRDHGVSSFWGYRNWIPRMGAVVHELRKVGYDISSKPNKKDQGCTYTLKETIAELELHRAIEDDINITTRKHGN